MLFNSHSFVFLFLPAALAGFFLLGRRDRVLAAAWLAACSLFFYAWWNPRFVLLLLGSACFNYACGYGLARARGRRAAVLLLLAVGANLVLLGFFKYADFFVSTANALDGGERALLHVVLPLGISFFTFTQIAFLVDVKRGIAREYRFVHYLLFVSYFPHLIAGPIIHHAEVMPQFERPETYVARAEAFAAGLTLFALGLGKKLLLADYLAEYADPVFEAARLGEAPRLLAAWAGALAYTLQLYFDFSGYSDMAIGLSLLFNVRLPFNFDSPYRARNIAEFWRRWHMTLSRFLHDYLYVPLGGNRRGPARRYANILVTMLLGGLWHGASWTFVAWGGLHGLYLVAHHAWRRARPRPAVASRASMMAATGATFLCVVVAWVLFRAPDFATAAVVLKGMAGMNGVSLPKTLEALLGAGALPGVAFEGAFGGVLSLQEKSVVPLALLLGIGLAIAWRLPSSQRWIGLVPREEGTRADGWRPTRGYAVATGLLFAVGVLHFARTSPFLYYQF